MGYVPNVLLAPCPACGGICGGPELKSRIGIFRRRGLWFRLECPCGVSGAWQKDDGSINMTNLASKGWDMVAGSPSMKMPAPGAK